MPATSPEATTATRSTSPLTPRQAEVFARVLAGEGCPEIARALGLRRHTVEHHLRALRRMHGAATTLELACIVWTQRCAELDARLSRSQATLAVLDRRRRE